MEIVWMYILTFIFPLNGILWLGMRNENIKKRKLLRSYMELRRGGKQ